MKIIDLSQEIYTGAPRFPGHPATTIEYVARHEDAANAPIQTEGHHVCGHDAPHVRPRADTLPIRSATLMKRETAPNIDQAPLEWFITRAIALDFTGKVEPMEEISLQLLQDELSGGEPDAAQRRHASFHGRAFQAHLSYGRLSHHVPGLGV